ncbi:hypothetical protein [Microbacterium hominis]|uniref:Uncharacterized protein n=1 Tax=Microbacterium hominis TaxID=162426 RepID=A0A7D4TPS1_9MICO|nr:hypothetical protein [Microbacterium hominis]QKJ18484.1 hypothetical protein HQM25_03160 [Microbacterium hominis]
MLLLVTAAEYEHRHESARRAREHAIMVSIRERREARAAEAWADAARTLTARRVTRASWPRPIGAHLHPTAA